MLIVNSSRFRARDNPTCYERKHNPESLFHLLKYEQAPAYFERLSFEGRYYLTKSPPSQPHIDVRSQNHKIENS